MNEHYPLPTDADTHTPYCQVCGHDTARLVPAGPHWVCEGCAEHWDSVMYPELLEDMLCQATP